jgi:hypothetical protein
MMIPISKPRARLAICAALLASLTPPALAEPARITPNQAIGTARLFIGTLAHVQSSRHYQAYGLLACEGNVCNVAFPQPGANRRLNLTHVSCVVTAERGTEFQRSLLVLSANNAVLMTYPLPLGWSTDGIFYLNQAVDVQVEATQQVNTNFAFAGNGVGGSCTLAGMLDTLQ